MAAKANARRPQVIDAENVTLLPAVRQRKPELDKLRGIRREMAFIYRQAERGQRDTADASRLVFMLTSIAKVLELTEVEERLKSLEERANGTL